MNRDGPSTAISFTLTILLVGRISTAPRASTGMKMKTRSHGWDACELVRSTPVLELSRTRTGSSVCIPTTISTTRIGFARGLRTEPGTWELFASITECVKSGAPRGGRLAMLRASRAALSLLLTPPPTNPRLSKFPVVLLASCVPRRKSDSLKN